MQFRFVVDRLQRADVFEPAEDVARCQQEGGEHQFLDGVGVGPRGVEHDDAALRAGTHGHVVEAHARTRDGADLGAEFIDVQPVAAQQDGVRIVNLRADLEAVFRETPKPFGCDLVESPDPVHDLLSSCELPAGRTLEFGDDERRAVTGREAGQPFPDRRREGGELSDGRDQCL